MPLMPTLYSLANDPDNPRDVLDEILDTTEPNYTAKKTAMWDRFAYRGIGNSDVDYWVAVMALRADELYNEYALKIKAVSEYYGDELLASRVDLTDGSVKSNSINRNYDPPEVTTSGDVATNYLADQGRTDFEQTTQSGLLPETVKAYKDAVEDIFREFAAEFDRYFYWGL